MAKEEKDSNDLESAKKLSELKEHVTTAMEASEITQSVRKGVLPPGIQRRTFRDKENTWYYAVAVYNPETSQMATDFSEKIRTTKAPDFKPSQDGIVGRSSQEKNTQSNVPRPSKELKAIPTGSFDDDDE